MSDNRVASRYAKSLLELAEEKGALEDIFSDMKQFNKVCKESREFELMLKNPIIKHDKKNAILKSVFEGKVHSITLALFDIITRKNREAVLPSLAKAFLTQYNIRKGIEEAKVTTAVALNEDLRKEMIDLVKRISGKKEVQLQEVVDKDMIGGYILKVGDRQIDDSLRSKIKELEYKFSQNPYIKEF